MEYDVFISYAHADKDEYIIPLKKALDRQKIKYWIDDDEMEWGDNFIKEIEKGLHNCRFGLICLSKNFLEKNWTLNEMHSFLAEQSKTGIKRILPLILNSKEIIYEKCPLLTPYVYREFLDDLDTLAMEMAALLKNTKFEQINKIDPKKSVCEFLSMEIKHIEDLCSHTSGKKLDNIFVERDFAEWETTGNHKVKEWHDVMQKLDNHDAVVILGDPGYGKTISLLHEVREQCQTAINSLNNQNTPLEKVKFGIYFHANKFAKSMVNYTQNVLEGIVNLIIENHQPVPTSLKSWIDKEIKQGHILLAVDALDEVTESDKEILKKCLSILAHQNSPCPLLLSARCLGYKTPLKARVSEWEILSFTTEQVRQAAQQWFSELPEFAEKFYKMVYSTPPLAELMIIPLLFMLACKIWEEDWKKAKLKDNPIAIFKTRCDLYDRSIKHFHDRWVDRLKIKPNLLEQNAFIPFLEELAWKLWELDQSETKFSWQKIDNVIKDVKKNYPLSNRDCLLGDICESGILIKYGTKTANAEYQFLHRTLLEFLAASFRARKAKNSTVDFQYMTYYFANTKTHVMLWMLAGKLENPTPLFEEIVRWANCQLEMPREESPSTESSVISQLLVNCLFECPNKSLDLNIKETIWQLVTRGLDRTQRQLRKREWQKLADWSFVYRALRSVENHEILSKADHVLSLVIDIRGIKKQKRGLLPKDELSNVVMRLEEGFKSRCPTVLWTTIWTIGTLHARGLPEFSTKFAYTLDEILKNEKCPHVRSIAARAIVQLQHPHAFTLLKELLDGECRMTATGAAIGMGRLMTFEAVEFLKVKADKEMKSSVSSSRDPLPVGIIGALEQVVDEASSKGKIKSVLKDEKLANIFMRALRNPLPLIKGTAASALGKMGWKEAWEDLKKMVEIPDNGEDDIRRMRGSAMFACDKLCLVIEESKFSKIVEFLRQKLRDKNEKVRRPASMGFEKLARRGYFSKDILPDLFEGTQDSDPVVAQNCLLTLTHFQNEAIFNELTQLIGKFDSQQRKSMAYFIAKNPTKMGIHLFQCLLNNDEDVILTILSAITEASQKAFEKNRNYMNDADILRSLVQCCLEFSKHREAKIVVTSQYAIQRLIELLQSTNINLFQKIRKKIAEQVRKLLNHTDEQVQAVASFTLKYIGIKSDISLLESLRNQSESEKVRNAAMNSIKHIKRRFKKG